MREAHTIHTTEPSSMQLTQFKPTQQGTCWSVPSSPNINVVWSFDQGLFHWNSTSQEYWFWWQRWLLDWWPPTKYKLRGILQYWRIIAPTNELPARPHALLLGRSLYGYCFVFMYSWLWFSQQPTCPPISHQLTCCTAPSFSLPQTHHVITQSCWHTWEYDPHINWYRRVSF